MAGDKKTFIVEMKSDANQVIADAQKIKQETSEIETKLTEQQQAWVSLGSTMTKVGAGMTAIFTVPIVGFFTSAIKTAAEYEQAMAGVQAISGETGQLFEALEEQAKQLGATTRFTAVEAAQGMTMLARAGWDANEILQGMPGLLDLAAAGAVDLAIAADIVSDVMMAFGENADQAGRYADVFAQAAANANTTVEALGKAMAYAAPAAAAAGFSIEQTAAALSALADAGIKGSRAGTTMDSVLRELRNKVVDGKLDFDAFTVSVYDNEGAMRDLFSILGDIEQSMAGMTQEQRDAALANVFTTRSLRGMNVWLTRGVGSLRELEGALLNAGGAAERMASIQMDTLQGAIIEMQSATEGLKIAFGEAFLPLATTVVRYITDGIRSITELDSEVIGLITGIALFVAAMGPLITILGVFITSVGMASILLPTFIAAMGTLVTTVLPIVAILGALAASVYGVMEGYKRWQESQLTLEDTVNASFDRIMGGYRAQSAEILADQAARNVEQIRQEIETLEAMGDAVDQSELADAYNRLNEAVLQEQRATHILRLEEQRQFLNAMNEDAEDSYKNFGDIAEEEWARIERSVAEAVEGQITELQKLYIAGDISLSEYNRLANGIEDWGRDLLTLAANDMNAFLAVHQSGMAEFGQIWNTELLKVEQLTPEMMKLL